MGFVGVFRVEGFGVQGLGCVRFRVLSLAFGNMGCVEDGVGFSPGTRGLNNFWPEEYSLCD